MTAALHSSQSVRYPDVQRELLVHRDYACWTGGHAKFLDYIAHVQAHPLWRAKIHLSDSSTRTKDNPFMSACPRVTQWCPESADAVLLGGMDWDMLGMGAPVPVINLVQHVRHADRGSRLRNFLSRPAIRLCVSDAVAAAIIATGEVRGPVRVIPAAVDVAMLAGIGARPPSSLVFIDAVKQHAFGHEVAARLRQQKLSVDLLVDRLPRPDYLQRMADASVVVTLPEAREGFYLPGIEAMAMGRALVQYDCVGSRQYLTHGRNGLVPQATPEAVAEAAGGLMSNPEQLGRFMVAGKVTSAGFDLMTERSRVHAVLDELDQLWKQV